MTKNGERGRYTWWRILLKALCGGFCILFAVLSVKFISADSGVISNAPVITDGRVDSANEGRFVIAQGQIAVEGTAFDPLFGISQDNCVVLRRLVEMYQYSPDDTIASAENTSRPQFFEQIEGKELPVAIRFYTPARVIAAVLALIVFIGLPAGIA